MSLYNKIPIWAVKSESLLLLDPTVQVKQHLLVSICPNEAGCPMFVNADLIAAGLSPFSPDTAALKAGKIMIRQMDEYIKHSSSFAFETT